MKLGSRPWVRAQICGGHTQARAWLLLGWTPYSCDVSQAEHKAQVRAEMEILDPWAEGIGKGYRRGW